MHITLYSCTTSMIGISIGGEMSSTFKGIGRKPTMDHQLTKLTQNFNNWWLPNTQILVNVKIVRLNGVTSGETRKNCVEGPQIFLNKNICYCKAHKNLSSNFFYKIRLYTLKWYNLCQNNDFILILAYNLFW
jgi:hypothetical protein